MPKNPPTEKRLTKMRKIQKKSLDGFTYQIVNSADALIGNTPLMELIGIEKAFGLNAKILAKLESFNPAGSIKDRVAKQMIDDAFSEGKISAGATVIEPTSGNTEIGLALVCKARGLNAVIVMPDTMSVERRKIIAAYGAKLVLTDGKLGMRGAIEKAEKLHKEIENSIIAGQFENPSNPKAHYLSTAPEIFAATVTLAKKAENEGKTFVVIFPDSGERYFSTTLFDN